MISAPTVNNIAATVGTLAPIGVVYPTLQPGTYMVCPLRQCWNCVGTFATWDLSLRYCPRCRANELRESMRWSRVRQLQRIAAPYMARDEYIKPKRERKTRSWRERLVDAFKAQGALTSTEIHGIANTSAQRVQFLMAQDGVLIVPVGHRRSLHSSRMLTEYAISE